MGGSGVQRPLKFIKYLHEFGWNPIVICPEPGMYHTFDESLQNELDALNIEIHRVKANTLFHLTSRKDKPKKVEINNGTARVLRRVLRFFYYPDNKRGWIKPALEIAEKISNEKKIEAIFSTAPPFSNHVLGAKLKERTQLPLVLDYRDLWHANHFQTGLFQWQRKIMEKMELFALSKADAVVCLDNVMANSLESAYSDLNLRLNVISHGFDPEDFESTQKPTLQYQEGKFNLLYSGLFYESNQPDRFFEAVKYIQQNHPQVFRKLALHFQGGLDSRIQKLVKSLGLQNLVFDYGYVSHDVAVANLKRADVLWMISNFSKELKQIKSGKLFEYIGAGKPMLALVHEGAARTLIEEYTLGYYAAPDNPGHIADELVQIIQNIPSSTGNDTQGTFQQRFNRKELTGKLADIFNEISS